MTHPNRGFVRVSGQQGVPGVPLVGTELHIDVQQSDGSWVPLRGVCSMDLRLRADEIVTATMVVEIGELRVVGPGLTLVTGRDFAPKWHDRLRAWLRGLKGNATTTTHVPAARVPTAKEVAKVFIREIDRAKISSLGPTATRADALERM